MVFISFTANSKNEMLSRNSAGDAFIVKCNFNQLTWLIKKSNHYISLYLRKKYTNDPSINMLLETAVRVVLSLTCIL